MRRFVLQQFTFMTLVQSDRALQRLVMHHRNNSSVLSLLGALLALLRCARVSLFSILVHYFKVTVIFPPTTSIKKTEKDKNQKS
jgi:hypothetical protein